MWEVRDGVSREAARKVVHSVLAFEVDEDRGHHPFEVDHLLEQVARIGERTSAVLEIGVLGAKHPLAETRRLDGDSSPFRLDRLAPHFRIALLRVRYFGTVDVLRKDRFVFEELDQAVEQGGNGRSESWATAGRFELGVSG